MDAAPDEVGALRLSFRGAMIEAGFYFDWRFCKAVFSCSQ